jgi:hypothetical protein
LTSFGKTALGFSRNPLGIIALFIVLLYGIASLLLGLSGQNLEPAQRWPLVWFLAVFPLVVLLVFAWLVAHHHTKLYAPKDFARDESFFRVLTAEDHRARLENEIESLQADELRAEAGAAPGAALQASPATTTDIRRTYVLAEDLVLRKIESELGVPIRRQSKIEFGGAEMTFDGVAVDGDRIVAIEVKVFGVSFPYTAVEALIHQTASFRREILPSQSDVLLLLLALVPLTNMAPTDELRIRNRLSPFIAEAGMDVNVRFFDLNALRKTFGIDEPESPGRA